jgi:hypothetical protein
MLLFRHDRKSQMCRDYDAFDFTAFMDDYMKAHPEVTIDQKRGWNIYWNPQQLDQEKTPCPSHENPTRK